MERDRPPVTEMGAPRFPGGPGNVVQSPSNHDVEQAIRRLDGMEFHIVYLATCDPTAFLGICGGPDWYGVIVTEHDRLANIVNIHELSEDIEEIMCGGQPSGFSRCHLVDLHTALAAALHYLDNAEAAATLCWEWVPL